MFDGVEETRYNIFDEELPTDSFLFDCNSFEPQTIRLY